VRVRIKASASHLRPKVAARVGTINEDRLDDNKIYSVLWDGVKAIIRRQIPGGSS
jgi:hypothetical protein